MMAHACLKACLPLCIFVKQIHVCEMCVYFTSPWWISWYAVMNEKKNISPVILVLCLPSMVMTYDCLCHLRLNDATVIQLCSLSDSVTAASDLTLDLLGFSNLKSLHGKFEKKNVIPLFFDCKLGHKYILLLKWITEFWVAALLRLTFLFSC